MRSYSITPCSTREQVQFVTFLNKVGGYDEVMRLSREVRAIRRAGHSPKLVLDPETKKYTAQISTP